MSKSELCGLVQTVLGPVGPEELGPTTTHEHLLIDFSSMFNPPTEASERYKAFQPVTLANRGWVSYDPFRNQDNLQLLNEDTAVSETLLYKIAGGGTIVDATTIGIGRDPMALTRISRATGLHIVMGAGYYVDAAHPDGMDDRSEGDLARQIAGEITDGVGDTGVKAGIIGELGCTWPLSENERKVLRGAAVAQRETGASILIHPGRNRAAPFEIVEVLTEAGADVSRVIMGHLERTIDDPDTLIDLAGKGVCMEYDLFGWETSYYPLGEFDMLSDAQRIDFIEILIKEGFADQIVIAHDVFAKHRLVKYGGHGYSHILRNIVPRMRERGISEEHIHSIIEANPARLLTIY